MLAVITGRDDRIPISLDGSGAAWARAWEGGVKGLRVAWSPDLGITRLDPEVARTCRQAALRFESLGCAVEPAHPDLRGIEQIIPPLRAHPSTAVFARALENKLSGVANEFFKKFLVLAEHTSVADLGRAESRRNETWLGIERCKRQRCRYAFA